MSRHHGGAAKLRHTLQAAASRASWERVSYHSNKALYAGAQSYGLLKDTESFFVAGDLSLGQSLAISAAVAYVAQDLVSEGIAFLLRKGGVDSRLSPAAIDVLADGLATIVLGTAVAAFTGSALVFAGLMVPILVGAARHAAHAGLFTKMGQATRNGARASGRAIFSIAGTIAKVLLEVPLGLAPVLSASPKGGAPVPQVACVAFEATTTLRSPTLWDKRAKEPPDRHDPGLLPLCGGVGE